MASSENGFINLLVAKSVLIILLAEADRTI